MQTEQLTDSDLIKLFREGENPNYAMNLLVRKYQKHVYYHVRRMVIDHDDANDIVQEVFIKIWKNIGTFRGDSELFTWIYRIATNECLNFLKKKKLRHLLSFTDYETVLADQLMSDNYFNGNAAERKLQLALLTLPEKQRLVFNLRYYDQMSYEQMSKILATSEGALKASYHLAYKKIEKMLLNN